jgi:ABC-type nickel/cobalt efflux system permease component RcnA
MQIHFYVRRVAILVIALFAFFSSAVVVSAHPLGNFTINHYARLESTPDQIRVRYVLDFAEIPAFQEKQTMDRDGSGDISEIERGLYLDAQRTLLLPNIHLAVNGRAVPLEFEPDSADLEFLPGQGGLEVMRLTAWLRAPFQITPSGQEIVFRDDNYSSRIGWREILVRAGTGTAVKDSSVSNQDISQELTIFPEESLNNPRNDREARFTMIAGEGTVSNVNSESPTKEALGTFDRTREEFAKLITTQQEQSPSVLLFSFLAALGLGALHAFSPGHGKAVVGAYLIGSRGTWKHALFLGGVVTTTHTAGVYVLGFVTLFLSAYILPEQLFPWLGFISGLLVAIIGVQLFLQRLRAARAHTSSYDRAMEQLQGSDVAHLSARTDVGTSDRLLTYAHPDVITHSSIPLSIGTVDSVRVSSSQVAALAPVAYSSGHTHSHHFNSPQEEEAHAREHLVSIDTIAKPTWKNLLSLGISGGLLPCPSALVVMLSAIALGRVLYGLFLIVGFSIGLAGVLVLTGLALLYAGKVAGRRFAGPRVGWFFRYLPIFGAFLVAILGVGVALDALSQTGLLR